MFIKKKILFIIFAKVTIFVQLVFCDNNLSNNDIRSSENMCSNNTSALKLLSRSRRYLGFKKGARVAVSTYIIEITSLYLRG